MEGGEEPFAIEVPGQNVNGMEGEVVEGGNVEYDDNANVSEVDEKVKVDGEGDEVPVAEQNEGVDFDWLEEGLEGPDLGQLHGLRGMELGTL
nr:hypothetical protein CFP56_37028 [Quercus suber]